MNADSLLSVEDLRIRFRMRRGTATAVDGVDFAVRRGEVLGIVGESGSGKSQILLSIMGLSWGDWRFGSGLQRSCAHFFLWLRDWWRQQHDG